MEVSLHGNNKKMEELKIGSKKIGEKNPTYIIAEIGLNHQGDINLAKKLVDIAVDAGVDCVKFQKRNLKSLYKDQVLDKIDDQEHALHYLLGHIVSCELSEADMAELYHYSKEKNVDFICTPWEEASLRFLSTLNLPAYKIGSPDMFNFPLIHEVIKLKKPVVISTGMSYVSEIDTLIEFLNKNNAQYILMHCNSTYPSPYHDLNLNFLPVLASKSRFPIGYSGHEQGITVSLAAVAMGARVIEKHITTDRTLPGPDHKASLEPGEFKELVTQIRLLEESLGEAVRYPSRGEFMNRENLSKSLVLVHDMKIGDTLNYEDITLRSPGKGTNPMKLQHFIGRKLIKRDLKADEYLLESDVDYYDTASISGMNIKHRWGIVVRLSDIDDLLSKTNPTFVEVHLTSSDVKMDLSKINKTYDLDLVVHGPEYDDDFVLDLSSMDDANRQRSIDFFNKTLDHARELKKMFKNKNELVKFIIHPGGMNMAYPLNDNIAELNENLLKSLKQLNGEGLEMIIENMPPFPWYFGGQWHHSSFMSAEEIVEFSKRSGYGIVFDTSHAALYCNYAGKSLEEFAKVILPVTKYLHISDAAKFNGEGMKIGDGTIDFKSLLPHIVATDLWFIPEIWQGHKFGGEDFILAIKNLKLINSDL